MFKKNFNTHGALKQQCPRDLHILLTLCHDERNDDDYDDGDDDHHNYY